MLLRRVVPGLILLCAAGAARADHNHITVASISTPEGPKAVSVAGYYPLESDVWIDEEDGRLMKGERMLVVEFHDELVDPGPYSGWIGSLELRLTSDYYFATGLLDGGNFWYEIASVEFIGGVPGDLVYGHFDEDTGLFVGDADSTGATRVERSINVGTGSHDHSQAAVMSSTYGAFDVTLVAWDSNGVYLDSDPVIVRFAVRPCPADYDRNGFVNGDDFDTFLAYFGAGSDEADFDGNGFVNGDDFDAFAAAFDAGC